MSRSDRGQLAFEAACILLEEGVSEYYEAKRIAAERLTGGRGGRVALPSNREIRNAMLAITRLDSQSRFRHLARLRTVALRVMEALARFDPHLIGSVAKGDVHANSDVDLHLFCHDHQALERRLAVFGFDAERIERQVVKDGVVQLYVHYRFMEDEVPVELSVYEPLERHKVSLSSTDRKPIDRVPIRRVRILLAEVKQRVCDPDQ